jgi:hypothetical protein
MNCPPPCLRTRRKQIKGWAARGTSVLAIDPS